MEGKKLRVENSQHSRKVTSHGITLKKLALSTEFIRVTKYKISSPWKPIKNYSLAKEANNTFGGNKLHIYNKSKAWKVCGDLSKYVRVRWKETIWKSNARN